MQVSVSVFVFASVQMWVEPLVTFWAWAAGSWGGCSPESCARVQVHLTLACSHAPCLPFGLSSLKLWNHHNVGRHEPWGKNKKTKTEKQWHIQCIHIFFYLAFYRFRLMFCLVFCNIFITFLTLSNLTDLVSLWKWSDPLQRWCLRRCPCRLARSGCSIWDILSVSI